MKKRHTLLSTRFEQQYFRKALKQNLMIALVAIALVFPILFYTCYSIVHSETELVRETCERMAAEVSSELQKANNMAKAIAKDANLMALAAMDTPFTAQDYWKCSKALNAVQLHSQTLDSIEEVFVYIGGSGACLTTECYFDSLQQAAVIYDVDWLPGVIAESPNKGTGYYSFAMNSLTKHSYTINDFDVADIPVSFGHCTATLNGITTVVLFKADYLTGMLPGSFADKAKLQLLTRAGNVLFEYNALGEGTSANRLVVRQAYAREGTVQVLVSIPFMALLSIISSVLLIYIGGTICALLVPTWMAYRMTIRQFEPIRRLMLKMEQHGLEIDENATPEDGLAEHLNTIYIASQSAHQDAVQMRDVLQQNISRLLYHGVADLDREWLLDIPEVYAVAYGCIAWHGDEKESLAPIAFMRQMVRQHSGLNSLQMLGENSFAFILPIADGDAEHAIQWATHTLVPALNARFASQLTLSVSAPTHGAGQVYRALEQARTLMVNSGEPDGKSPAPFQSGLSLYHTIVAGDAELAQRTIRDLLHSRVITRYGTREIYYYIADIIRFAAQDVGRPITDELPSYSLSLPIDQQGELLARTAARVCEHSVQRKALQAQDKQRAIIAYILQHLGNYDLSVRKLCDRFHFSERGMIAAIASQTGTTLANFLTQERMKEAARLLMETDMQVNVICETVGYNTISAFHKAFKRMYGVAPGEYRKQSKRHAKQDGHEAAHP